MWANPPRLLVRRPSPTTVGFTVSNASPNVSVTSKSLVYVKGFLRVVLSSLAIAIVYLKFQCAASNGSAQAPNCPEWLGPGVEGALSFALRAPWHFVGVICSVVLYLCCQRPYTEESLLVLQSLGVQTSTSSSTYLSTATTRFIPTAEIQDMFIHEAFIGWEVRYYLAIVVKNEAQLTVVFPVRRTVRESWTPADSTKKFLPRRAILEEVWRGARSCLYPDLHRGSDGASSSRPKS